MVKLGSLWSVAALAMMAVGAPVLADRPDVTLAVTMTNDAAANQIRVFDTSSNVLLQTISTRGKGGVAGNARGVKQYNGDIVAVVNNGSNTVAIFKRDGNRLKFDKLVVTTSAPVSIDFGNDHMYVAGATTIDSFVLRRDNVEFMDGTTGLELAGGGAPPVGSTAQVGVINERTLLVTLVKARGFTLHRVSISPVAIRIRPGHSRTFTVTITGPTSRQVDSGWITWRGANGTLVRIPVVISD